MSVCLVVMLKNLIITVRPAKATIRLLNEGGPWKVIVLHHSLERGGNSQSLFVLLWIPVTLLDTERARETKGKEREVDDGTQREPGAKGAGVRKE